MRISNNRVQYYVEGKCEKQLVKTLIIHRLIVPGQTEVLNPVQKTIKSSHLRSLPAKTNIVLIFDTDVPETEILEKNLQFLSSHPHINSIITIPQVMNLEDELLRCTDVRQPKDLINCAHASDFKTMFIEEKHLYDKLSFHHFDLAQLWSSEFPEPFRKIGITNMSNLIKQKNR